VHGLNKVSIGAMMWMCWCSSLA